MDKQEFTRRTLAAEGMLYRISCGMLQNPQDRLDAVQEAIVKAWANVHHLRNPRFFETWLTRILINECHNIQNARKNIVTLESLSEQGRWEDGSKPLRDAILALEEELRLPVLLHYMEGYRIREAAEILRLPEGTVKTRLARAKRKLKTLLEEEEI